MNLSDDWRFLFPVCSIFAPPSLAPPIAAASHGPLLFSPLRPPTPLLSLPSPLPSPPSPQPSTPAHRDNLLSFLVSTSGLPFPALASLSEPLLAAPSPPSPPPSNLLAALRARSSSYPLILFFPYGENAEDIAIVPLDPSSVAASTPVSLSVQSEGFKHPAHRIQRLAATPVQLPWSSQPGEGSGEISEPEDACSCPEYCRLHTVNGRRRKSSTGLPARPRQRTRGARKVAPPVVEGFLLAATLYSVSWFRVESQGTDSPVLVPVAKQGFEAAVVHACWSKHLPSECMVLLENGDLCWFDLDTRRGGKMKVGSGRNRDWGHWLSCAYGAQPWMVIVASSKAVLLVDLRFGDRGEYKVIADVERPGFFETEPFPRIEHYLAFCKAEFDGFHVSVVTERYLILLDVRQPLMPVFAWQHGLKSPNHVAMFQLSELRPSKEFEWASNSGFAILVGSFGNADFSLFCYGPKEQGCPENSHVYAWDLPSRLSLTGQHRSCSSGIMKEVFSTPASGYGGYAYQQSMNSIIGYYVLPQDLSLLEPSFAGFALIRLTELGKLEMQKYRASRDSPDDSPCDESQHAFWVSSSSSSLDTRGENFCTRYSFLKLHFLSAYLEGNLCSALAKHDTTGQQIIVSEDVSAFAKGNSRSSSQSLSDFLCNATIPMNIFEIACQSILNGLPSNILHVTFSKYKDMVACSAENSLIHYLEVPSCPPHKLRRFLLAKPSGTSQMVTGKVRSGNALVGPVLPVPVLLAMEAMNTGLESHSEEETAESDLVSHRCTEVLEACVPEISIADTDNGNGLSASQKLDEEKPFFVYEPQIENRVAFDKTAIKKEKEQESLDDRTCLQTPAKTYKDENFMTFVCGKAGVLDSGPEPGTPDLFDFSPVRMDFDSPSIETKPAEENVYKCLKKQFISWQNRFKPSQNFCSSYNIQKPP